MTLPDNWLATLLDTRFRLTGEARTFQEHRDRDGATWYQGDPTPMCVETRRVTQRRIEQTNPDGAVVYYWETQS